jgi:hypothetical protein
VGVCLCCWCRQWVYFWHVCVMLDGCICVLGLVVLWRLDDEYSDLMVLWTGLRNGREATIFGYC